MHGHGLDAHAHPQRCSNEMERAQEYGPARAIGVGVLEASLQLACRSSLVLSAAGPDAAVQHLCHSRCRTQQVSAYGRRDMLEIDVHIDVPFASFTLYLRIVT